MHSTEPVTKQLMAENDKVYTMGSVLHTFVTHDHVHLYTPPISTA